MFKKKINLILLFVIFLSACTESSNSDSSFVPQNDISVSQIGYNKKISVVVEDGRSDDAVIGRSALGKNVILDKQDLLDNIKLQLKNGLLDNGFQAINTDKQNSAKLSVKIVVIQYRPMNNEISTSTLATVVIEAVAISNGKQLIKDYRSDDRYYYLLFPSLQKDINQINLTMKNTLIKLLTDKQLIEILGN